MKTIFAFAIATAAFVGFSTAAQANGNVPCVQVGKEFYGNCGKTQRAFPPGFKHQDYRKMQSHRHTEGF